MKKWSIPMIALFVGALVVSAAYAAGPAGGRGHMSDRDPAYSERAIRVLDLTAEQKAKVENLRTAFWRETKPIRDQLFIKGGDLKMLWLEAKPDEAKIKALQKEIGALRDQLEDKMTSYRLAVLNVLNPEQQAKLRSRFMTPRMARGSGPSGVMPVSCDGSGLGRGGR